MGTSPGIVEGEWDDQPRNWRTFFKRWRQSKELFRFEVVRTEAVSAEGFFVIGRAIAGRVQEGDALVVDVGEEPVPHPGSSPSTTPCRTRASSTCSWLFT